MATPAQIHTNQANSQYSTGPKSPEGKSRSAENALRHGLASGRLIIPGECRDEYERLETDLVKDHRPADTIETLLVQQLAQHYWLMQRALKLQTKAFSESDTIPKDLAILMRYHSANERAFHKALGALTKLQNQRKKDEIGFGSQKQYLKTQIAKVNSLRREQLWNSPTPGQPGWEPNPTLETLTYQEELVHPKS